MVNWKELKAIVAMGLVTCITITCLAMGFDGMLVSVLLTAIGAIGGYELAKRRESIE